MSTADAPTVTDLHDEPRRLPVESSQEQFRAHIWTARTDRVRMPSGDVVARDVVTHPGAVGVLVLDARERVLLQQQYRHAVGHALWEIPAGLLDVEGEAPLAAAQRELREEADLVAARWDVLADYYTSPGMSSEAFRCYLARDLSEVSEDERFTREDEEADMSVAWVPLDDAVGLVLSGAVHNPSAVHGILAAAAVRARGWQGLRPADAPWSERFPEGWG